jgi:hypothetical protein
VKVLYIAGTGRSGTTLCTCCLMRRTDRMLFTALTLPLPVYYHPLLAPARRQRADLIGP